MEALLKLSEVAELEDVNSNTILKRIHRGSLKAIKAKNEHGDRLGFEYRVSVSDLSAKAQRAYYARLKSEQKVVEVKEAEEEQRERVSLEDLTDKQREQVIYWQKVIKSWRQYLGDDHGNKGVKTKAFIEMHNIQNPDQKISERTLYNKWKLWQAHGDAGLADSRCQSKRKGRTTIAPEAWSVFFQLWADESEPTSQWCYTQTQAFIKRELPKLMPLPAVDSFLRQVKQLPPAVVTYYRSGDKALTDEILPFVRRDYESIDSNEWWTSDYHTLDFMVQDDQTGEVFRPHLVVWMDIRSRKILGWRLRKNSDSDGVILSFKDAVGEYGIPENVYLDNGREYLTYAFGGRGRRKSAPNVKHATPILDLLGVTMHNALPRNGKAKVIERSFGDFGAWFSKSFTTYCGNRPENRPERHNDLMKNKNNIPLFSEVKTLMGTFIDGLHNARESQAVGLEGKTPNATYAQCLYKKRTATADQLNLLLVKSERLQTVGRNGVKVKLGSKELWFCNEELKINYVGWKVYVKYDPDNLNEVRVYDDQEKLLTVVGQLAGGSYELGKDSEAVKTVNHLRKAEKQKAIAYMVEQEDRQAIPPRTEILKMVAEDNIAKDTSPGADAKILEPLSWQERLLPTASGDAGVIDWETMNKNSAKRREES